VLPGLKGSHADEFEVPASVASSGSPLTVINCICSSLPLSNINATVDHEVCMTYSSYAKKLPAGLVAHLDTMLSATCFGGEAACDPQWWKTYLDITKRIEGDVCARLGVSPHRAPSASSSSMHAAPSTDAMCEMAVERASMSKSSVRKVQIAGNAFDVAYSEASKSAPCSVSLKRLSRVWDAPSNAFKDDLSVGGRFLSDFARIVTDRGLSAAIRVNLGDKTINYTTKEAAMKAMRILIEYMTEYNKSRRMRKNTSVLKVNSKPEVDSRRGAKRSRAASPAPSASLETQ
jgi:ribosomal protein L25 (general stress protein Ctc)